MNKSNNNNNNMKATVDRNVNSHCGQDFGSSDSYGCQLQHLTGSIVPSRFKVALEATLSTPTVDGKHSVFQVFGNSNSYRNVSF